MTYWEGPSRWINAALLFIIGLLVFDALFSLLGAQESNLIVGGVAAMAGLFLAPFRGMWEGQPELVTTFLALLGYCLLAGIALAITKTVQTSRREARRRTASSAYRAEHDEPLPEETREFTGDSARDRTQRL
jgi:hypothetical protein